MKVLLTVTAIFEGITGVSLLIMPSLFASLLLGVEIGEPAGIVVARIAGAALLALAIACWQARGGGGSALGVVCAMLTYNVAAAAILALAGIHHGLQSTMLWPAIVIHISLAVWCLLALSKRRTE